MSETDHGRGTGDGGRTRVGTRSCITSWSGRATLSDLLRRPTPSPSETPRAPGRGGPTGLLSVSLVVRGPWSPWYPDRLPPPTPVILEGCGVPSSEVLSVRLPESTWTSTLVSCTGVPGTPASWSRRGVLRPFYRLRARGRPRSRPRRGLPGCDPRVCRRGVRRDVGHEGPSSIPLPDR